MNAKARHDLHGYLRALLTELAARLGDGWAVADGRAPELVRRRPDAVESLGFDPNTKGLPHLLLNPSARVAFDVAATPLAQRPARPGFDPASLAFSERWSVLVTLKPTPSWLPLRTRLAWKLKAPPVFLDADVNERPGDRARELEEPIRRALLPFLAQFPSLRAARDAVAKGIGASLPGAIPQRLAELDVALGVAPPRGAAD